MRFRTKEKPRGVLKARDQKRLVLLMLAFFVVMIGVSVVRHPQMWAHLFPGDPVVTTEPSDSSSAEVEADLAMAQTGLQLREDEFWSSPDTSAESDSSESVVEHRTLKVSLQKSGLEYDTYGLPKVPKELMTDVKDDVIGVHSTEAEAYYASMRLASKIASSAKGKAQPGHYALFMDAPRSARGRAFRVTGKLRRLSFVKGRTNTFGVGNVFDAWLNTDDSGTQLMHVVATDADPALRRLMPIDGLNQSIDFEHENAPEIFFTGYFFKKEAYASQGMTAEDPRLAVAPLFVAGNLQKLDLTQATAGTAARLTPYLWWLAFLILVAVAMITWSFAASDAAHQSTRAHQLTRLPAVASFENIDAETIDETLRRLETGSSS